MSLNFDEKAEIELIRAIRNDCLVANANLGFAPKTSEGEKEWLKHYEHLPKELEWKPEDLEWAVNMVTATL